MTLVGIAIVAFGITLAKTFNQKSYKTASTDIGGVIAFVLENGGSAIGTVMILSGILLILGASAGLFQIFS
jgi:hypothetical protein